MTATTRGDLRREAARLAAQGLSGRAIAARLAVNESTVRRWKNAAPGPADTPHAAPDDAPAAPHAAPAADRVTLPLDAATRDHLATLATAGHTPEDAIRLALGVLAQAYEYAWDYGLTPRGTAPEYRVTIRGDRPPPGTTW